MKWQHHKPVTLATLSLLLAFGAGLRCSSGGTGAADTTLVDQADTGQDQRDGRGGEDLAGHLDGANATDRLADGVADTVPQDQLTDGASGDTGGELPWDRVEGDLLDHVTDACVPDCQGKECGPSNCGSSCGQCDSDHYCQGFACVPKVTDADCSAIEEHANWDLCESGPGFCTAVFYDSAGCVAVCAAVGMVCHSVMENIDGQCAADLDRPPLACQPESGHKSDWCHCVDPQTCVPQCLGKTCGDDGCGGNCGLCAATDACQGFQCVPKTTGPDCSTLPYDPQALLAERVGFGATTTGGSPGNVYHVTSKANSGPGTLRHALESTENYWIVFDVEGEFQCTFSQTIQVKSNKTVDGRGRDVRLRDCRFDIKPGVQNLIFTDFEAYFHDPQDNEGDLFYARGPGSTSPDSYTTKRIWWHHLDLHHAGDGLIDIRGATSITISWCHFHNHTKVMLHTYDMDENPDPGKHITYHHNWFDTVTRRGPQFAYGKADFFNNYQYHWYEYGAASVDNAQFLSEANIYEAREGTVCIIPCPDPSPHGGGNDFIVSKKGLVNDWAPKDSVGFIRSVGDWKLNGAQVTEHQPSTVFLRSTYYQATPEPANDALRQKIKLEAGPRKQYCP